jgi:hypothetical protein
MQVLYVPIASIVAANVRPFKPLSCAPPRPLCFADILDRSASRGLG